MNNFTYAEIESLLETHDADVDAAEAQGIATGLLCLDDRSAGDSWLKVLFQHPPNLSAFEYNLLITLYKKTHDALIADTFEFDLFLPDDEAMLSEQLIALCNWCRGFLFGVGSGSTNATWPGDSGEILKDIIEITKLDTQTYAEGDEQDLMEIHEYLRAAVMLFRDDLRGNHVGLH